MLLNIYYQGLCIFILGLILGSFYNVVVYRSLSGESIINPPSKCPKCGHSLLWWQNIPVISYFLLKGECYFCKQPIDIQYPIVELLSGVMFLVTFLKFSFTPKMFFLDVVLSILLIMALTDLRQKVISFNLSLGLIFFALLVNYQDLLSSIIGLFLAGIIVVGLRYFFKKRYSKEVIGEGDIYILAALGALSGMRYLGLLLIMVLMFQLIFSLPTFLENIDKDIKSKIYAGFTWFALSYALVFLMRIHCISCKLPIKVLLIVNLLISMYFFTKYIIYKIKNSEKTAITALSPAIFLSVFVYLLLIQ